MTDLLHRPTSAAPTASRPAGQGPRPLAVSAVAAGLGSAGGSLLICLALALTGWFLADAGAHGQTTDALRVGACAWLLGHGSRLGVGGVPVGIVPLGLSLLLGWTSYRAGRWAGRTSQRGDDRAFALGALVHTGLYVVLVVVTAVLAGGAAVSVSLPRAMLGALLLGGVAGSLGMAAGGGRLAVWSRRIPPVVSATVRTAGAALAVVLAASAALTGFALVRHLNQGATVMSSLDLTTGNAIIYTLVGVLAAPNAVLFGSAYLIGPGFAVGTGTGVSTAAVTLGPLPAFPLLAGLPADGTPPAWLVALSAAPVLLTALTVMLVQRRHPATAWEVGVGRGVIGGLAAAVGWALLVALAGGPMGTGRMADIGAPLGEVLLHAAGELALGGLLGGVLATWWQRRRGTEPEPLRADPAGPADLDGEDTAVVALPADLAVVNSPAGAATGVAPLAVDTVDTVDTEDTAEVSLPSDLAVVNSADRDGGGAAADVGREDTAEVSLSADENDLGGVPEGTTDREDTAVVPLPEDR